MWSCVCVCGICCSFFRFFFFFFSVNIVCKLAMSQQKLYYSTALHIGRSKKCKYSTPHSISTEYYHFFYSLYTLSEHSKPLFSSSRFSIPFLYSILSHFINFMQQVVCKQVDSSFVRILQMCGTLTVIFFFILCWEMKERYYQYEHSLLRQCILIRKRKWTIEHTNTNL